MSRKDKDEWYVGYDIKEDSPYLLQDWVFQYLPAETCKIMTDLTSG